MGRTRELMQHLDVVDRLLPLLLQGFKTSTIRWQEAPISLGALEYRCESNPKVKVRVWVVKVTHMPLSAAAAYLGRAAEWSPDIMLIGMRAHYPSIELSDMVQVIEHLTPEESKPKLMSSMKILLIHGLIGSLNDPRIVDAFGDVEVLAPDLLGYGEFASFPTENLTLQDQADHLANWLRGSSSESVHVVGHSVGGAVGLLLAYTYPALVASYVSVEGNMTLKDAFWSAELSRKPDSEVASIVESYRQDVRSWIGAAGVEPTALALDIAGAWIDHQPPSTIKAQAKAVVEATRNDEYLNKLRVLIQRGHWIHLVAGEKSRSDWDIPAWVEQASTSTTTMENRGHLMMLESPEEFADTIVRVLSPV